MTKNENTTDRVIRIIAGLALLIAGLVSQGTLAVVLVVLGAVLLITAATGFCLLYKLFNFSTIKSKKDSD